MAYNFLTTTNCICDVFQYIRSA